MLNNPPINELEKKAGCRYLLVSAVAKKAKAIMEINRTEAIEEARTDNKMPTKDTKLSQQDAEKNARPTIADNVALDMAVEQFYNNEYRIISTDSSAE